MFWKRKIKEVDPKDIGITEEMMAEWDDPKCKTISFSMEQLDFMADISSKQLRVLVTFTPEQIDAMRNAIERNAKRHVH